MLRKRPKYIKVKGSFYQRLAYDEPTPLPATESIPMDGAELQRVVRDVILKIDAQLEKLDDAIAAADKAGIPSKDLFSLREYLRKVASQQNSVGAEYGLF